MTPDREAQLLESTNLLLNARRTVQPIAALPAELAPVSLDESFWVQDQLIQDYGEVGGYKIGAPTADATPMLLPDAAGVDGGFRRDVWGAAVSRGWRRRLRFCWGRTCRRGRLAIRDEEVYAAVASCHPAIEVIESGLVDPLLPELKLQMIADLQMHGGFAYGAAVSGWRGHRLDEGNGDNGGGRVDPGGARGVEHVRRPAAAAAVPGE